MDLGLETGAPFAVLRLSDGLILLPEQQRFVHLCQALSSSLTAARLTSDDLLATLPGIRDSGEADNGFQPLQSTNRAGPPLRPWPKT